jgi:RHS repeat-associated protein
MSMRRFAALVLMLVVLLPVLPTAAPPPNTRWAGRPLGAAERAPEQRSGTADGVRHNARAQSTSTSLESPPRDQPRPEGAVPDVAPPLPAVNRHEDEPDTVRPELRRRQDMAPLDAQAVERPQDRTATTETFDNPDGTRTLRLHSVRSNVRQPDGSFVPADPTLVAGERLAPKAAPVPVSFAATAAAPDLVRVDLGEGHELTYGLREAADVRGVVDGAAVTYRGVRDGVDLRLTSTPTGMKDEIVLASADSASTSEFSLRLRAMRPRLAESGEVELVDGDRVVGVVPAGFMHDSAADPARSTAVRYSLVEERDGTWTLRVEVDRGWLTDPARVYPVVVDPSVVQLTDGADDLYVRQGETGRPGAIDLRAGRVEDKLSRSYLRFAVPDVLRNQYVVGASLLLDNVYSTTCTPRPVTVFEVTQPWDTRMAWPGAAVGRALSTESFANGQPCGAPAWRSFPLDPDVLTGWTHGTALHHGFSVRATDEGDGHGKRFGSHESGNPPHLDVRYSPEGAAFDVTSVTVPTNVTEGKLVATVTNQGSSTWPAGQTFKFGYVIAGHAPRVDGVLPHAVAPGQSVVVEVPLSRVAPGEHLVRLSMWGPDGRDFFTAHEVPYGEFTLRVRNVPPTTDYQQPPNGAVLETRTPTLFAKGMDPDLWPQRGLSYKYRICTDQALTLDCQESDWTGQNWVPSPLFWSRTYYWGIKVSDTADVTPGWAVLAFTTRVHQPEITSHLAGSPGSTEGPGLDPLIGNYSAVVTDASVATAGPDLTITRTYNSTDPRRDTAFGTGWSSRLDTRFEHDDDGSGNVVITLPSGRQVRFGKNPDATFAAPAGQGVDLVYTGGGDAKYVLRDNSGSRWVFDLPGRLVSILDPAGLEETLTHGPDDRVATITNRVSGRALRVTWTGAHVTRVSTDAPQAGAQPLVWTYEYDGDRLTKACLPGAAPNCTTYRHQSGSHYRSTVLDNNPRAYYRLGETSGSSFATVTARRPGADAAAQHGVVLGAEGGVLGTADTAGVFDGVSSRVTLPEKLISESMSSSVELWFRTTEDGVLVSYADREFPATATQSTPVLYVGTDGLLYGGFATRGTGGSRQIVSTAEVADDRWHHAVLSAAVDSQTLYLDGTAVGTLPGLVDHRDRTRLTIGAGSGADWPATNGGAFHFSGTIDEVAVYTHTVGALAARRHFAAGQTADLLTGVVLPRGNQHALLTYDDVQDRVRTLVDHQNRTWTLDTPTVLDAARTATLRGPSTHGDWTYTADLDHGGRTTSRTHNGATRRLEYNTAGFLSATVDENGHRTEQTTDARGNVLSRTTCRAPGSCNTTYHTYVASDQPLDPRRDKLASTSDARSSGPDDTRYRTTFSYDPRGVPTGVVHPTVDGVVSAPTETSAFSTGAEDAVGGGKVPAGLLVRDTDRRGGVTRREYRSNGDLALVVSPTGLRTTFEYDELGRQRTATEANSGQAVIGVTGTEYTERSQVAKVTEPAVVNTVTGATHTAVTEYAYDPNGNVIRTTTSDNGQQPRTTRTTYDQSDRVAETTFPDETRETRSYTDNALTHTTHDARGVDWITRYDEHGRVLVRTASGAGVDPANSSATSLRLEARGYDPAGRLASVVDAIGRRTDHAYYDDGLPATTTRIGYVEPSGARRDVVLELLRYDPAGNVVEQVAQGGAATTRTFDPAGFVTTSTFDPTGLNRKVTYRRDAAGNPVRVELRGAAAPDRVETTTYQYNALGQVVREDAHLDASTVLSTVLDRDERGLVRVSTDRRQISTRYEYDSHGALVKTVDPPTDAWVAGTATPGFVRTTALGRNAFGEVTHSRDGTGAVTSTEYDVMGRVVAGTLPDYTPPGGRALRSVTRTRYDALGNAVESTDPLGRVTTRTYDPYGRVLTATLPQVGDLPSVLTFQYDRVGEPVSRTDAAGAENRATYDELGRRITATQVERATDPVSYFTTRFTYDDANHAVAVESPQGGRSSATHNRAGQVLTATDATSRVTSFDYDIAGRQASVTDPAGVVSSTTHDLLGRPVRVAQSAGGQERRSSTTEYDGNGNVVRTVSPQGRTTTFGFDALNRPVVQVERVDAAKSITTRTGYDKLGNRSRFVDGRGNATDYTSTPWGTPESTLEASSAPVADRTWTTVYDIAGQVEQLIKPGGVVVGREHDAQGRLTVERSAGAGDRTFGYDRAGRLNRVDGPAGPTSYHHDDRGNLVSSAGAAGTATYTYNGDGTLATRTDASGNATFTYDPAGRLRTTADPVTARTASYGYDPAGRLGSVVDTSVGGRVVRQLGYDELSRLSSDRVEQSGEPGVPPRVLLGADYGYDRDDKLTSKSGNTYGYDGAGRLTSWTDPAGTATAYGWDDAGNRTSAGTDTFTYDERNRLTSGAGATHTYTPRGTLATTTENGTTRTLAFDGFDRLVTNGAASYGYDSLDRVASRNGTRFTYAGLSNEVVSDGGRLISRLPDGTAFSDKPVGGTGRMLFADRHGDVIGRYVDNSVDGKRTFDPFGEVTSTSGGASPNGYQGDWTDPDTGTVNMTARWYAPGTGTFLSRDDWTIPPTPSAAGNRFQYGDNDPLGRADPDGHAPVPLICLPDFNPKQSKSSTYWSIFWDALTGSSACTARTASGCDDQPRPPGGYWCVEKGTKNRCGARSCGEPFVWAPTRARGMPVECSRGAACYDKTGPGKPGKPVVPRDPGRPGGSGGPRLIPLPPPPPPWIGFAVRPLPPPPAGTTVVPRPPGVPSTDSFTDVIQVAGALLEAATSITVAGAGAEAQSIVNGIGVVLPFLFEWGLPEADPSSEPEEPEERREQSCVDGSMPHSIWYGPLEPYSRVADSVKWRATGAAACLRVTRPSAPRTPPTPEGFGSDDPLANARGHLIGYIFFGADVLENFVPINQAKTNSSMMYHGVEKRIRNHVQRGEAIFYQVKPVYVGRDPVPYGIRVQARGRSYFCAVVIPNDTVNRGFEGCPT